MTQPPTAVQRLLDGVTTADWDGIEQHLTPDVVLDGTMPGWRYQYQGADRVAAEFRSWTARGPWRSQVRTLKSGQTVVLELQLDLDSDTQEIRCRWASVFDLRDGRIAEMRYYCAGEWDAATLRHIEAHAPKVERPRAQVMTSSRPV